MTSLIFKSFLLIPQIVLASVLRQNVGATPIKERKNILQYDFIYKKRVAYPTLLFISIPFLVIFIDLGIIFIFVICYKSFYL